MNAARTAPRSQRTRKRVLIAAVVAAAALLLIWIVLAKLMRPKPKPPPPTPVTVAEAVQGAVPIILRGMGQVQAFNTYTARSRVDGNITAIGYAEGGRVKAGDLLVQIDPRPYRAALEQARAAKARDEAQLADAKVNLKRYGDLLPDGLATKQTFDTQRATVKQLAATLKADDAEIESAEVNLGYTEIRAPFDGRTGQRLVDIGNLVGAAAQTPLVVLTQTQPIFVAFTLPELNLDQVVAAMHRGRVEVQAFDSEDQKPIASGELTVLDNGVDPGTGTVKLKAQFDNRDENLWPGEFVNAHIVTAVRADGVTIPSGAVQMGPNGRFVFRVGAGEKVEVVPVTVGQIESGTALVDEGLKAHDRIVVDGAFGLSAGEVVQVTGRADAGSTKGTLDLTGRTRDAPNSGGANRGGGRDEGRHGDSDRGDSAEDGGAKSDDDRQGPRPSPPQPTEQQPPQKQTPPGGHALSGHEGPGARTPLPSERQVPEPPRDASQGKKNGDDHGR